MMHLQEAVPLFAKVLRSQFTAAFGGLWKSKANLRQICWVLDMEGAVRAGSHPKTFVGGTRLISVGGKGLHQGRSPRKLG